MGIFILLCLNGMYIYSLIERIHRNLERPQREDAEFPSQAVDTASIIKVEVLNGAGVSGIAQRVTDYLRKEGFDVINYGNAESFSFYETIVLDRIGNRHRAQRVAQAVGAGTVVEQKNPFLALDVTMILCRDFKTLIPFTMKGETHDQ